MYHFITHLLSSASVLFIILVSFNRYFAVATQSSTATKRNKKQTSFILTLFILRFAAAFGILVARRVLCGIAFFGHLVISISTFGK